MDFREFLLFDNVNNRQSNASGGAGINLSKPASPQKGNVSSENPGKEKLSGGPFGGGNESPPPQASFFNPSFKDDAAQLKKFNKERAVGISGNSVDPRFRAFKLQPSPMLPGVISPKNKQDPAGTKAVPPPRMSEG